MFVDITCPYCGVVTKEQVELYEINKMPKMFMCPADVGCGIYFAATFAVAVTVKAYKLDG